MCNYQTSETSIWEILKNISGILLPISSLIVSIVALKLTRKISFKKTVKDKQFELVNELIDLINKSQIHFSWKERENQGGISTMSVYHFIYSNFKERSQYLFQRKKMFFQVNSFDDYKFLQLMGMQYLPPEIYSVLDKFRPRDVEIVTYEQVEATNNYVAHITLSQKTNELNYFSSNSPDHKTFEDFYNLIVELFNTINEWLKKHGADDLMYKKTLIIHTSKQIQNKSI